MLSRTLSAACAAALMIGFGTVASKAADSVTARLQAIAQACSNDVESLCPGTKPGGGRIISCLASNIMSASPTCRGSMVSAMNEVCGNDLARLCPGVPTGTGEAADCLKTHVSELKGSCKDAANRLAAK